MIVHFSMEMRMPIINYGQAFSYIRESYHQLKRVEFISGRISYRT
jgi:hypothetical protein